MKKWNVGGLALLLVVSVLIVLFGIHHIKILPIILLMLFGFIPVGVERFKPNKTNTLVWFGYWLLSAFILFLLSVVLVFDLDTAYARPGIEYVVEISVYGLYGLSFIFGLLAATNLIYFFVKLFISPKQKS